MEMQKRRTTNFSLAGAVSTGKDLVAMLRDAALLLMAALLIGWPQTVNNILVNAGFEEGSFAGIKWKVKLTKSDDALIDAQATIADLREQDKKLGAAIEDLSGQIFGKGITEGLTEGFMPGEGLEERLAELNQQNEKLLASSAKVQANLESTTSENAPLVQKAQAASGSIGTWGVVYGGDRELKAAKYEVDTVAPKLGLTNAAVYYRRGSYRSVATTSNRLRAEELLTKAKERRKDSYIVNMSTWCPEIVEEEGFLKCASS